MIPSFLVSKIKITQALMPNRAFKQRFKIETEEIHDSINIFAFLQPRSPAQIIAQLEHDQSDSIDSRVKELEEEHK